MTCLILILQIINDDGFLFYKKGLVFFHSYNRIDSSHVISYNENRIPIHQNIRVQYQKKNERIMQLDFETNFVDIFSEAHRKMKTAENYLGQRKTDRVELLLDSIRQNYPDFPFLYTSYLYLARLLLSITKFELYCRQAENYFNRMQLKEKVLFYHFQYDFWRDYYSKKSKDKQHLAKALAAVMNAYKLDQRDDLKRIINRLKKELE